MTSTRTRILRILAALALGITLAVATAHTTLTFDLGDGAVDYTDHDTDEVYPAFAMVDGTLIVTFHDDAPCNALPAISFDIPDLGKEDIFGNDIGATIADIGDVEWRADGADTPSSWSLTGVTYVHTDVALADAVEAYANAFRSLGFEVVIHNTPSANMKVAMVSHGDATARIALRKSGAGEVTVDVDAL